MGFASNHGVIRKTGCISKKPPGRVASGQEPFFINRRRTCHEPFAMGGKHMRQLKICPKVPRKSTTFPLSQLERESLRSVLAKLEKDGDTRGRIILELLNSDLQALRVAA
jgi:hypothetical protein